MVIAIDMENSPGARCAEMVDVGGKTWKAFLFPLELVLQGAHALLVGVDSGSDGVNIL